jgi:hypothetical protein
MWFGEHPTDDMTSSLGSIAGRPVLSSFIPKNKKTRPAKKKDTNIKRIAPSCSTVPCADLLAMAAAGSSIVGNDTIMIAPNAPAKNNPRKKTMHPIMRTPPDGRIIAPHVGHKPTVPSTVVPHPRLIQLLVFAIDLGPSLDGGQSASVDLYASEQALTDALGGLKEPFADRCIWCNLD